MLLMFLLRALVINFKISKKNYGKRAKSCVDDITVNIKISLIFLFIVPESHKIFNSVGFNLQGSYLTDDE